MCITHKIKCKFFGERKGANYDLKSANKTEIGFSSQQLSVAILALKIQGIIFLH